MGLEYDDASFARIMEKYLHLDLYPDAMLALEAMAEKKLAILSNGSPDMLNALDRKTQPRETFYDGYVVNAIMDAAYKSVETKKWEPVEITDWRGQAETSHKVERSDYDADHILIKEEKMPDGRTKVILKNKTTGRISQKTLA